MCGRFTQYTPKKQIAEVFSAAMMKAHPLTDLYHDSPIPSTVNFPIQAAVVGLSGPCLKRSVWPCKRRGTIRILTRFNMSRPEGASGAMIYRQTFPYAGLFPFSNASCCVMKTPSLVLPYQRVPGQW
jgi:hypothetical protein